MSVETVPIIHQFSNRLSEHDNKHSGFVRDEEFLEQSVTVLTDFAPCRSLVTYSKLPSVTETISTF
jgi:hypothetical protein